MLLNYDENCSVIYAILIFQSNNSGYELFKILWILHLRFLSFDAPQRLIDASNFIPDTYFLQFQTWLS